MKATVVIPTKNRTTEVLRAVSSVKPSETLSVIVVDDGSDIPAAEVQLELSNPYIKVILNGGASRPAGARNVGVGISEINLCSFSMTTIRCAEW